MMPVHTREVDVRCDNAGKWGSVLVDQLTLRVVDVLRSCCGDGCLWYLVRDTTADTACALLNCEEVAS
mgnify:CR=1 FL=1